jgi:precorrin-6Y C5,15-methyltransferase (decarboxylating)
VDDETVPVNVVGVVGGEVFGEAARRVCADADVLVGSPRQLAGFAAAGREQERIELAGELSSVVDDIAARRAAGRHVCVLASGDPGFFGIVRLLAGRLGSRSLRVHPAPSSVSLAWAAVGLSWDDGEVVSAHGRSLADAVAIATRSAKVAVLTAPASPPEALGKQLIADGCGPRRVVVASRLGEFDQEVVDTDLDGLADGQFDAMSVVLLIVPDHASETPSISWGRHEARFAHRDAMITKAETRSVVLGRLELPRAGVLWDVGAGSGSVGVEAASIAPGLRVYAVEQAVADAARITANSSDLGVSANVQVVVGRAPDAVAGLPNPDRVFVGGGGLEVVRACWDRLVPGGRLVATFVLLDRALAALDLLGEMIQLRVDRCVPVGDVGVRLEPMNPVFVCSGQR